MYSNTRAKQKTKDGAKGNGTKPKDQMGFGEYLRKVAERNALKGASNRENRADDDDPDYDPVKAPFKPPWRDDDEELKPGVVKIHGSQFTMRGVKIDFPYRAYKSQVAMINQIMTGLDAGRNCLLESPTGTGKTLVLLCSVIAWQQECKKKGVKFWKKNLVCQCDELNAAINQSNQPRKDSKRIIDVSPISAPVKKFREDGSSKANMAAAACSPVQVSSTPSSSSKSSVSPSMSEHDKALKEGFSSFRRFLLQHTSTSNPADGTPNDENLKNGNCCKLLDLSSSSTLSVQSKDGNGLKKAPQPEIDIVELSDDEDDDDFKSPTPRKDFQIALQEPRQRAGAAVKAEFSEEDSSFSDCDGEQSKYFPSMKNTDAVPKAQQEFDDSDDFAPPRMKIICDACRNESKGPKYPKIYYGTRTHKQIEQVIREYKKTNYNKVKMAILSSRDRTCINSEIQNRKDKNEACKELQKQNKRGGRGCLFYKRNESDKIFNTEFIVKREQPYDLEDAVKFGKKMCSCPYYGLDGLHKFADIIFCPYNYLLDENIRSAKRLSLKDAVIIFDEAHNIDDVCRDAASMSITMLTARQCAKALYPILKYPIDKEKKKAAAKFIELYTRIAEYLRGPHSENISSCELTYDGRQLIAIFEDWGITADNYQEYLQSFNILKAEEEDEDKVEAEVEDDGAEHEFLSSSLIQHLEDKKHEIDVIDENGEPSSSESTGSMVPNMVIMSLADLFRSWTFFFKGGKDLPHIDDFKGILKREPADSLNELVMAGDERLVASLDVICLNPGLAFDSVEKASYSVIVTSGTLSPLESFSGELQCDFGQKLSAPHVVPKENVMAALITHGPSKKILEGTYKNLNRDTYQDFTYHDELGSALLRIIQSVPNGVLVFFPSYGMLARLCKRWRQTRLLDQMKSTKHEFFEEPRDSRQFDKDMKKYAQVIARNRDVLMFAVCRGKVSEGIDFADNMARAVITIGIPFPSFAETAVKLKKEYNQTKSKVNPQLLDGDQWYNCAAFRALNQAFGRCLRHKDDWGAIIMIESRLREPRYGRKLSSWLQPHIRHFPDFNDFENTLKKFVETKKSIEHN